MRMEGFRMKRLRYQVAVSLDGFIAGPDGEYDWIVSDSSIDFGALFKNSTRPSWDARRTKC